jgi:tricorn protease
MRRHAFGVFALSHVTVPPRPFRKYAMPLTHSFARAIIALATSSVCVSCAQAQPATGPAEAQPLAGNAIARMAPTTLPADSVDLPRYPSISPDGKAVVFSWRGDLWKVDAAGGAATRLTTHPADETVSAFSPDGRQIAFVSTRDGGGVFVMNADGTGVKQVTRTDRPLALNGWTIDPERGPLIVVSTRGEIEVFNNPRPSVVSPDGGEITPLFGAFGLEPSVSPDGTKVLFTRGTSSWLRRGYRGSDNRNVWLYDRKANTYKQLTTWAGNDGRPKWVDDERYVYASDREGGVTQLYLNSINAPEAQAKRITPDAPADVDGVDVTRDGKLVFARWNQLYTADVKNAGAPAASPALAIKAGDDADDPLYVRDVARAATEARLSPDGKTIAVVAFGQVFVRSTDSKATPRRVSTATARHTDVAWSADGTRLFYTSRESGKEAIVAAKVKLTRGEVRKQLEESNAPAGRGQRGTRSTTRPSASAPAAPAATHGPDDAVDPAADEALDQQRQPRPRGPEPTPGTPGTPGAAGAGSASAATSGGSSGGPAPDRGGSPESARWADAIAFEYETVTASPEGDSGAEPSPDGKQLAFARGRGSVMVMDLATKEVRTIFKGWSDSLEIVWHPSNKFIAYTTEDENNNADIWIVPVDASKPAVNITRHPDNDYSPRFSADGRVLAFLSQRVENEADVWAVWLDKDKEALTAPELEQYYKDAAAFARTRRPPQPSESRATTRRSTTGPSTGAANASTTQPSELSLRAAIRDWLLEGSPATQPSGASTGSSASSASNAGTVLVRVPGTNMVRRVPAGSVTGGSSGASGSSASGEEREGAIKVLESLDLDDAYLRVRRVSSAPGNESNLQIAPAGDKFYALATIGTSRGLWVFDRAVPEPRRLGTTAPGVQAITLTGDQLVVVDQGRAGVVKLPAGEIESYDIADRLVYNPREFARTKFVEAARVLETQFYDASMKGLDWPKVVAVYEKLGEAARTSDEFDWVFNKLLGELNASHTGISSRGDEDAPVGSRLPPGKLGIDAKRVDAGYEVTKVLEQGPAGRGAMRLKVGDVITAVEMKPIEAGQTLDQALAGRVGVETLVTVKRDGHDVQLLLTPVSGRAIPTLVYNEWRLANAKKVEQLSGGRLGYIHIQGMNQESLDVFERDLYAAAMGKDGLVLDVRNNGGGSTADRLLASICAPRHAWAVPRGSGATSHYSYPQDRLFIMRYDRPINMLCNERSFSNAEITAHAFKTLKRGTLVGQQTYGGVISTGSASLVDGTTVRTPGRGWYTLDGKDMELNGALPDLLVPSTPEDESAGNDKQLEAAVKDLLDRLGK